MPIFTNSLFEALGDSLTYIWSVLAEANPVPDWPAIEAQFDSWLAAEHPAYTKPSETTINSWLALDFSTQPVPPAYREYVTIVVLFLFYLHQQEMAP